MQVPGRRKRPHTASTPSPPLRERTSRFCVVDGIIHRFEYSFVRSIMYVLTVVTTPPQLTLANVRKHAHASKVLVRLRYENELLELIVLDNGSGVLISELDYQQGGFGLMGLRERIELLGGQVIYGPVEPVGYRVSVQIHVPLKLSTIDTAEGVVSGG